VLELDSGLLNVGSPFERERKRIQRFGDWRKGILQWIVAIEWPVRLLENASTRS
jgi:hypothetical protein